MKFAFIIDPIQLLDPGHDTSVALMEAAQAAGHEVWITQAEWLGVEMGKAMARMQPVTLTPVTLGDNRWVAVKEWFLLGDMVYQPLEAMDVVMMRTDPPVTIPYLYTTYVLDYIDPTKTLVMNSPQGLRAANEKNVRPAIYPGDPRNYCESRQGGHSEGRGALGASRAEAPGWQGGRGHFIFGTGRSQFQLDD